MPTIWSTGRGKIKNDLGYLVTQLGFLCNNDGKKIIFHTGIFSEQETRWVGRPKI